MPILMSLDEFMSIDMSEERNVKSGIYLVMLEDEPYNSPLKNREKRCLIKPLSPIVSATKSVKVTEWLMILSVK